MIVGYLGEIPFVTSRDYLVTFDDYQRQGEGRWAKHEIVNNKPVLEFLGPDLEEISFRISLRRDHGIEPEALLKQLRKMRDTGQAVPLVLGSKVIGEAIKTQILKAPYANNVGLWVLTRINESVKHWAGGNLYSVDVDVTISEYAGRATL